MAAIEAYPRSATIVAKEDVVVEEIDQSQLNDFFTEDPSMIRKIMNNLGYRLKELTADYDMVKTVIADIKKDGKKDESFFAKIKKFAEYYTSGKNKIEQPSAENFREIAERFRGKKDSGESYDKGTIIFKEGEVGKSMYIVYDGTVGIYCNYGKDNQNKLTELYPVTCFGEMGLISGEARSATAVAEQPGTYVEIIREDELEDIFKKEPVKIEMILKHLSYRLRKLTYDYLEACKELNDIYNR
jgi:CRP-like cAMP-binding protein